MGNRKKELKFLTKYYEDIKIADDEVFLYCTYPDIVKGHYVVSSYGHIINFMTNYVLKGTPDKDGYLKCRLKSETKGKHKLVSVHRLVAWEYCKHKKGCNIVNHLDTNILNNHCTNLEWTTVKGNTQHAIEHGLTIRAGSNSIGARYSKEIVDDVCSKLESGMSVYQVYETYYPYSTEKEHHAFYMFIYKLKTDPAYLYPDRNKYNIDTEHISSEKRRWTKEELEELEWMITHGKTNKEILKYYGFSKEKDKGAKRIADKTGDLRKKLGIPNPDKVKFEKLDKEITKLIKAGKTNREIFDIYGVKHFRDSDNFTIINYVAKIRKRLNIENPK